MTSAKPSPEPSTGPATVRHFLRDDDLSPAEQARVIDRAIAGKADRLGDRCLAGPQSVAVIFDKPTLRSQLSFTVGIAELGGCPLMIEGRLAQIGTRESIADTARVVGRQVSAIVWRTYGQERIDEMASLAGVPVVNALTDEFHPCQILADLVTIREHKGPLGGLTLAYFGDGANNMAHSYALGGAVAGLHVRIAAPAGHHPDLAILAAARVAAAETAGSVLVTESAHEAAEGADVVATDTWVSMGMEGHHETRPSEISRFAPYTVDEAILAAAAPDVVFLHCLPAHRGFEVSASVIDGPRSLVWDEAENRLHAQKALLSFLLQQSGRGKG